MEPKCPKSPKRFTRLTPSITTDSEHEVLVELDSDSDLPNLKPRKADAPTKSRKKTEDWKKPASTLDFQSDHPVLSEDLIYHLMDQNKLLMDQNKTLTMRAGSLEPVKDGDEPPKSPTTYHRSPSDEVVFPAPQPYPWEVSIPRKDPPKPLSDDQLLTNFRDLWEVLPRLLQVVEAAASSKISTNGKSDLTNDLAPFDCLPFYDPFMSNAELFERQKDTFLNKLQDAERKFGVRPSLKKAKKGKAKRMFGELKREDLMPSFWKGLGLVRIVLMVVIMVQLSFIGGDVVRVEKESGKMWGWLGGS
jgi:hypothetical protein